MVSVSQYNYALIEISDTLYSLPYTWLLRKISCMKRQFFCILLYITKQSLLYCICLQCKKQRTVT